MTRQSPACGASLGIDRILSLIQSKPQKIVTKVYVGIWSQADIQLAYNLNENLINSGINSSINLYSFKIREQLSYASSEGFTYFVFQGPDEVNKNMFIIKDLINRSQEIVNYNTLIEIIKG